MIATIETKFYLRNGQTILSRETYDFSSRSEEENIEKIERVICAKSLKLDEAMKTGSPKIFTDNDTGVLTSEIVAYEVRLIEAVTEEFDF